MPAVEGTSLAASKRKSKPLLTLIPEEERAISHRFGIVLVGQNAREFAHEAVDSEMAEAYQPSKKASKTEEDGGDIQKSLSVHIESEGKEGDSQLMLFCPVGSGSKDLARLRFHPCVTFSDSLPLSKDPAVASNMVIALLFWRVPKSPGEAEERMSTDETIRDFISRMAEVRHVNPRLRPIVALLAFAVDDTQREKLEAFIKQQSQFIQIEPHFFDDDEEGSIMDGLQEIVDSAIRQKTKRQSTVVMTQPPDVGGGKSCCSLQ